MSEAYWISSDFFQHELFRQPHPLSYGEAWLDILQLCNQEKEREKEINGRKAKEGRGQLVYSMRKLQERWKWKSSKKVFNFLKRLERDEAILIENMNHVSRLTVLNFDDFFLKQTLEKKKAEKAPVPEKSDNGFEEFFAIYDKEVGREKTKRLWKKNNYSEATKAKIMSHAKWYIESTPDKKYRKAPYNYLDEETWKDEIIEENGESQQQPAKETARQPRIILNK